jgi:hypothetical protein
MKKEDLTPWYEGQVEIFARLRNELNHVIANDGKKEDLTPWYEVQVEIFARLRNELNHVIANDGISGYRQSVLFWSL